MKNEVWGWMTKSDSDPQWNCAGEASGFWNAMALIHSHNAQKTKFTGKEPPEDLRRSIFQPVAQAKYRLVLSSISCFIAGFVTGMAIMALL